MFLRFVIENYASFRGEAELSFIATARKDTPDWRMPSVHVSQGVLPVLGVWGANASGKTNLLRALQFMGVAVEQSHAHWTRTQTVPWSPWRLARDGGQPPTRMELEFVIDEIRYLFGFEIAATGFVQEWLYRWKRTRRQVLYHRDHSQPQAERFYFGPSFEGSRRHLAGSTRDNGLFLSAAAEHGHEQLRAVANAIIAGIRPQRRVELSGIPVFRRNEFIVDPAFRPSLVKLLRAADLGVCDVRLDKIEADRPPIPPDADQIFTRGFIDEPRATWRDRAFVRLVLVHGSSDTETWELPPEEESRGTHVLIARLRDIVHAMREGGLLLIDDLDTNLHPGLCAALVGLFADPVTNPAGAQLLFTTHERSLLQQLRTDEVVLIDKSRSGESTVRVASDYRAIRTRDNLRLAHEQGRIGGVPVLGDWSNVFDEN